MLDNHFTQIVFTFRGNQPSGNHFVSLWRNLVFLTFLTGITIQGGHIVAKIVTRDIWCSNGVLHIIDNILHIPTRNVMDELARHSEIRYFSNFMGHLIWRMSNFLCCRENYHSKVEHITVENSNLGHCNIYVRSLYDWNEYIFDILTVRLQHWAINCDD